MLLRNKGMATLLWQYERVVALPLGHVMPMSKNLPRRDKATLADFGRPQSVPFCCSLIIPTLFGDSSIDDRPSRRSPSFNVPAPVGRLPADRTTRVSHFKLTVKCQHFTCKRAGRETRKGHISPVGNGKKADQLDGVYGTGETSHFLMIPWA